MNEADKVKYVESQIEEMAKIIWRNEVDIFIIDNIKPENNKANIAMQDKKEELEKSNSQLSQSSFVLEQLKAELAK